MLPKLHKRKRNNEIIETTMCIHNMEGNINVEARPIVAGPFATPEAYQKYFISLRNHQ